MTNSCVGGFRQQTFQAFQENHSSPARPITGSLIEQLFVSQRQQRPLPSGRSSTVTIDSRPEHPGWPQPSLLALEPGRDDNGRERRPAPRRGRSGGLMASEQTRGWLNGSLIIPIRPPAALLAKGHTWIDVAVQATSGSARHALRIGLICTLAGNSNAPALEAIRIIKRRRRHGTRQRNHPSGCRG